jgi:hypothetical protein
VRRGGHDLFIPFSAVNEVAATPSFSSLTANRSTPRAGIGRHGRRDARRGAAGRDRAAAARRLEIVLHGRDGDRAAALGMGFLPLAPEEQRLVVEVQVPQ